VIIVQGYAEFVAELVFGLCSALLVIANLPAFNSKAFIYWPFFALRISIVYSDWS
jgi:hypothetical protein